SARQIAQTVHDAAARIARSAFEAYGSTRRCLRLGAPTAFQVRGVDGRGNAGAPQRTLAAPRRTSRTDRRAEVHEAGAPVVRLSARHQIARESGKFSSRRLC